MDMHCMLVTLVLAVTVCHPAGLEARRARPPVASSSFHLVKKSEIEAKFKRPNTIQNILNRDCRSA